MAKQANDPSGDWTAGIVAIFAALLLGGAIPIALYYTLYVPRVQARIAEEKRLEDQQATQAALVAREERVRKLEEDAAEMEKRLRQVEENFTAPVDRDVLISKITNFARDHNIRLPAEQANVLRAKIVYEGGQEITFAKGLKAVPIIINCQATFHDFCRFLTQIENMKDAVLIIESLDINGDQNGGNSHRFEVVLYSIERRDIAAVGTN
jgi:Tfp pilus assembly protein PilO